MVSSNPDTLGIIFPNSYDSLMPELTNDRLMASIPFAGRYRMVDFILSSMVNSGIDNISLIVRKNYLSLLDHLGSGREWDLTRKNGGLNIIPPFAQKTTRAGAGRVESVMSIVNFLRRQKEKYVVMADANLAVNFNFKSLLKTHAASGADVTVAYYRAEIEEDALNPGYNADELYYTLQLDGTRVKEMKINSPGEGMQNVSMNIYVIDRILLIKLIVEAYIDGKVYFERDVLIPQLSELNVQAFEFDGYVARIHNMKSYFEESMKLLDEKNLDALFSGNKIYTKVRDDHPTRYMNGARAKNVMVADGCIIEGEVENCILFRGVKIGKGAKVKNCILMQDTVVQDGAKIEYVVSDKNVTIMEGKEMCGADTFPVYVAKGKTV